MSSSKVQSSKEQGNISKNGTWKEVDQRFVQGEQNGPQPSTIVGVQNRWCSEEEYQWASGNGDGQIQTGGINTATSFNSTADAQSYDNSLTPSFLAPVDDFDQFFVQEAQGTETGAAYEYSDSFSDISAPVTPMSPMVLQAIVRPSTVMMAPIMTTLTTMAPPPTPMINSIPPAPAVGAPMTTTLMANPISPSASSISYPNLQQQGPVNKKDDPVYAARRHKNNLAAQASRQKKKNTYNEMVEKCKKKKEKIAKLREEYEKEKKARETSERHEKILRATMAQLHERVRVLENEAAMRKLADRQDMFAAVVTPGSQGFGSEQSLDFPNTGWA